MQDDPNQGIRGILRQALLSGAIVGVILLTVVGAIVLAYTMSGTRQGTPEARAFTLTPTPAATSTSAVVVMVTDTPAAPTATVQPGDTATPLPTQTLTPSPSQTSTLAATITRTATPQTPTATGTARLIATSTALPPSVTPACTPLVPAGWQIQAILATETLDSLAFRLSVSATQIRQVNCLASDTIAAGQKLYLPAGSSGTGAPCGAAPAGWIRYTVQPGDSLGALAASCGASLQTVMKVNCLQSSEWIYAGQMLYLPCQPRPRGVTPWAPRWPTPTPVYHWPTWTPVPWPTWTPVPWTGWTPVPTQPIAPPTSTPTGVFAWPTPAPQPTAIFWPTPVAPPTSVVFWPTPMPPVPQPTVDLPPPLSTPTPGG